MEYLRDQSAVEESATLLVAWLDLLTGMASGEEGARNVFESLLTSNAGKHQPLLTESLLQPSCVNTQLGTVLFTFLSVERERYYLKWIGITCPKNTLGCRHGKPLLRSLKTIDFGLLLFFARMESLSLLLQHCALYSKAICSKS